jgi:enoyl-CoA hydratase/carnithine racemase
VSRIRYEKGNRIARVTLDRPEAKNAIDPAMHEELVEVWKDFRDDAAVDVAILTGEGDAFCAGADLRSFVPKNYVEATPARVREIVDLGFGGITRGLHRIPKPIICGVGVAMQLVLTAEPIDAERALQCNMVTAVVPHERLTIEAEALAAQILRNSQRAVRSAKETILDVIGKPLDDQLRVEGFHSYTVLDRDEANERLRRFLAGEDT